MAEKIIQLEANGEFPFTFYIEKAIAEEMDKEYVLEGVASTTNIDHDNERMSKEALHAMANIINEKSVPLRVEHSKSSNAIIGKVFKAWVDDRNQLHIRASLDKSHPVSEPLYTSMKSEGKKMGFSVGGLVKRAVKEFSDSVGKLIKTFYDVELKEVSVTPRPANYDSWAISKSIAKDEVEAEAVRGMFYDEFLFSNPNMDYLQVFAKSIPDEAWRKVESPILVNKVNKDMTSETEMDEKKKSEKKDEEMDTTKAVSRKEFGVVVKAIETMGKAFDALVTKLTDGGAKDTNSPDKKKTPEEEQQTAKMGENAHDQNAPDKDKPKDESPAAKSSDEKDETKEKKADDKTDDYKIESVERAISSMEALTKRIQKAGDKETDSKDDTEKAGKEEDEKDEATKAGDNKDEKDETTKGPHQLDKFVFAVTKTIEAMVDKMEKGGTNVLGFKKSMVDAVVNDPKLQEEIQKMMKVPGVKRSVSMGVPYMVDKNGKRFALTATEVGASIVEKSRGVAKEGVKTFKELYKSDFSSVRENGEE